MQQQKPSAVKNKLFLKINILIYPEGWEGLTTISGAERQLSCSLDEHQVLRAGSLEKTLILGNPESRRRRRRRQKRWWDGITDPRDMSLSKLQNIVQDREARHIALHGVAESDMTFQLNNDNKISRWPRPPNSLVLLQTCFLNSVICPNIVSISVCELLLFP